MAWTDYSNTAPSAWYSNLGTEYTTVELYFNDSEIYDSIFFDGATYAGLNDVSNFLAIPGFDDGYLPAGIPDPISNNIDQGGGGGSTRPASGFLYPRGQG
jgi:hypothetical protein